MSARTEYRPETCDECGWDRERQWLVRGIPADAPIPRGWRVVKRTGAWKTIAGRTRFVTMCGCDA